MPVYPDFNTTSPSAARPDPKRYVDKPPILVAPAKYATRVSRRKQVLYDACLSRSNSTHTWRKPSFTLPSKHALVELAKGLLTQHAELRSLPPAVLCAALLSQVTSLPAETCNAIAAAFTGKLRDAARVALNWDGDVEVLDQKAWWARRGIEISKGFGPAKARRAYADTMARRAALAAKASASLCRSLKIAHGLGAPVPAVVSVSEGIASVEDTFDAGSASVGRRPAKPRTKKDRAQRT